MAKRLTGKTVAQASWREVLVAGGYAMKTRQLGTNGLKVSEIGFGCMGLNSTYSHSLANEESIRHRIQNIFLSVGACRFDLVKARPPLYFG
jgi:hypothetical protein